VKEHGYAGCDKPAVVLGGLADQRSRHENMAKTAMVPTETSDHIEEPDLNLSAEVT
jgi:hypothetical protein